MPITLVPDTTTFTLQNVTTIIYGDTAAGRNLSGCFSSAISSYFDEAYRGSKNSLLNFRNYGDPNCNLSTTDYTWAYNSTTTVSIQVTTNKTRWHLVNSSYANFTVAIYDEYNDVQITDGIYYSGCYIRITPKYTNTSGGYYHCYISIGDDEETQWEDCTFTGTQEYYTAPIPPYVDITCNDGTLTISHSSYTLNSGSNSLVINFTCSAMSPSPSNVYYTVVRNGLPKASGYTATVRVNISRQVTITLSETAQNGYSYTCYLTTSDVPA